MQVNIDFIANLENSRTLKVYDITTLGTPLPEDIYKMTLNIICSRIPNGRIDSPLDIIAYLRTKRIAEELYTITSEVLGLAGNQDIPDGVYHMYYNINNTQQRLHKFLMYQNVKTETEAILRDADYNVDVGDYELAYIEDSVNGKYDIENVRYAKTLLDNLEVLSQDPNEVEVNNTLDKLEKILGIIKNNQNE